MILCFFDTDKIRYSSRWGSSWSKWLAPYEPSTTLKFYAKQAGKKTLQIRTDKNTVIQTIAVDVTKGFNYVDYDLTISEKGRKKLLKEDTSIDINKAKNDKYYIPKGNYIVYLDGVTKGFEIK